MRVALYRRADPRRLYRRAAFAWLCVEFLCILDAEDARTIERDADQLRGAMRVNYAVLAPDKLADERAALADRAGWMTSAADGKARALAMLERGVKAHAEKGTPLPAGWRVMGSGLAVSSEGVRDG